MQTVFIFFISLSISFFITLLVFLFYLFILFIFWFYCTRFQTSIQFKRINVRCCWLVFSKYCLPIAKYVQFSILIFVIVFILFCFCLLLVACVFLNWILLNFPFYFKLIEFYITHLHTFYGLAIIETERKKIRKYKIIFYDFIIDLDFSIDFDCNVYHTICAAKSQSFYISILPTEMRNISIFYDFCSIFLYLQKIVFVYIHYAETIQRLCCCIYKYCKQLDAI